MTYLSPNELTKLADAILNSIGYSTSIRTIFLKDVNPQFRRLMAIDNLEMIQLDLDLQRLNDDQKLTDGSVPFYSWLQRALRYVQPFPAAFDLVQHALAAVEGKTIKAPPIINVQPPSQTTVNNIIREKIIHQNDMVSYAWLEAGYKAGISVARLMVPRIENGQVVKRIDGSKLLYSGTGWLITKELLITNQHVINARNDNEPDALPADFALQGEQTIVDFDFNADESEGIAVCSSKTEAADKQLDYAIIRLKKPVDRLIPARLLQQISVSLVEPQPVNIIQHPLGHAKKVAFRNNHIFESVDSRVRYFTDTEKGSSGSPVFNDNWQVIALHRASQLVDNVNYQGKNTGWVNEGVPLIAIFDHLKANFNSLYTEIINQ
jgi:V8-like Glu-specific endopeptidase